MTMDADRLMKVADAVREAEILDMGDYDLCAFGQYRRQNQIDSVNKCFTYLELGHHFGISRRDAIYLFSSCAYMHLGDKKEVARRIEEYVFKDGIYTFDFKNCKNLL